MYQVAYWRITHFVAKNLEFVQDWQASAQSLYTMAD